MENQPVKSHKKEYFIIFFALAILTIVEVYVPETPLSYTSKFISLTGLAVAKAALVAFFYMHLKDETAWLKFIALIPISAAVYTLVVVLETTRRDIKWDQIMVPTIFLLLFLVVVFVGLKKFLYLPDPKRMEK